MLNKRKLVFGVVGSRVFSGAHPLTIIFLFRIKHLDDIESDAIGRR